MNAQSCVPVLLMSKHQYFYIARKVIGAQSCFKTAPFRTREKRDRYIARSTDARLNFISGDLINEIFRVHRKLNHGISPLHARHIFICVFFHIDRDISFREKYQMKIQKVLSTKKNPACSASRCVKIVAPYTRLQCLCYFLIIQNKYMTLGTRAYKRV